MAKKSDQKKGTPVKKAAKKAATKKEKASTSIQAGEGTDVGETQAPSEAENLNEVNRDAAEEVTETIAAKKPRTGPAVNEIETTEGTEKKLTGYTLPKGVTFKRTIKGKEKEVSAKNITQGDAEYLIANNPVLAGQMVREWYSQDHDYFSDPGSRGIKQLKADKK